MLKPKLMAAFTKWRRDWEDEKHAKAAMSLEERLGEQLLTVTKQLQEARAEVAAAKAAGWDGAAAEAELERQLEERLALEKEKRIEHTKEMAVRRIGKRDLTRGWVAWLDQYLEQARMKRALLAAGSKLLKPKLVAAFQSWRREAEAEAFAKRSMTMGERLAAEVAERQRMQIDLQNQLQGVRVELEEARQAALEGRGLEAEMQRQLEERMAREKEKRIEHTKQMALKRIGKRDLTRGWVAWHDQYYEAKRMDRMLKGAGARLLRPKLSAAYNIWRRGWESEKARLLKMESMSVEDRLRAQLVALKEELTVARTAALNGEGLEDALQREMEQRLEAEREKRIEHTKQMAIMRIGKRELTRGWLGWLEQYRERQRLKRALLHASSKMLRPKLVACFTLWRDDWRAEAQAKRTKHLGTQLSRETREGREAKRELELVRAELEELRHATLEGRGEELEAQRMLEAELEAEREKRIEHIQYVAGRRIGNRTLSLGWTKWHGDWAESKRLERVLKGACNKVIRPKLVAAFQHWRLDWLAEKQAERSAGLLGQLKASKREIHRKEAELQVVRDELDSMRKSILDGRGVEAEQKRQMEERLEREREKRIEHTQQMAIRRLMKRDLARGWEGWATPHLERKRRIRLLKQAGARLLRPKLAKGFLLWRRLANTRKQAKATGNLSASLSEQAKAREVLEIKLEKVSREYVDQRQLDDVALKDERKAMSDTKQQVTELVKELATEREKNKVINAKEQKANALLEESKKKHTRAQELLAEQQKQAAAHLGKQLADVRGSLEKQLSGAHKTIAELKDQLATLQAEKVRAINSGSSHGERRGSVAVESAEAEEKRKKNTGILGNVDFDEDQPLGEQLKSALTKNAIRVLDLFREWDANGDGEVSKREFREAMPKLGFILPTKVIDDLFDQHDPDGSGVMDFKELQKMLRSTKSPPAGASKLWGAAKEGAGAAKAANAFTAKLKAKAAQK